MRRREYLVTTLAAGATVTLAGCAGSDSIVSGSTDSEEVWEHELEEGDELELEVTLDAGAFADGIVQRMADVETVGSVSIEEEGTTETETLTVPSTDEYMTILDVEDGGDATLILRSAE